MLKKIKGFLVEEGGLGTVELVLLVAVLVGLALIFKTAIAEFVRDVLGKIKGNEIDPQKI
ncbi:Flp1 family type IVb pilin [Alkaliphilus hydrothermalis]|uniref:Putative Flagellin Flp1-like domain-containing protein n=1 Tax=Alkaliphilus hydrothermalis TaxID=1482730 RepID=A0ABS2NSA8_9FIRM|nr:Flp1 family type IVb pilin [Alkaliphilus hydrothermalis]MBM7615823.1 hypothetical protein [Alkaliphilus hydrothermalis]